MDLSTTLPLIGAGAIFGGGLMYVAICVGAKFAQTVDRAFADLGDDVE